MHISIIIMLSVLAFLVIAYLWYQDGMDMKILKQIVFVSAITIPVFASILIIWPHTELYKEVKEQQRLNRVAFSDSWYLYAPENPFDEESLAPPEKPIEKMYFAMVNWVAVEYVISAIIFIVSGIAIYKNRADILLWFKSLGAGRNDEKEDI